LDQDDYAIQDRGISEFPGLYFLGFEPDIIAMIYNSVKLMVV
jgi:hypothetical protein